ncbi:uncharacterized protein LOC111709214 isoform X2 [Eurytemora carolleeae]|uniref:uncharacterized protein LOC111709214 isoform X2 n=1 Tax=Eurytemora carolleeae TaxID=1294199 RepID=UPI000C78A87A|nr:uncharacterized protein LOC111709214 isoform X2 [Eurytemora carolleeae]|eukprot:XP_023338597.1 uncharacterized protein LOC111709214 isoform X2 [Eurytemora affinis]
MDKKCNIGVKQVPARTYSTQLIRRNPQEEWGLEVQGGWDGESGSWLQVSRIRPGSPADLAGIRTGDLLISLDGEIVLFYQQNEYSK